MYLRFVRPTLIKGMAARCATQVNDLLDWFRENLAEPERFTRSAFRATGSAEFTKGLSWFKPEASEMLAKARDLIRPSARQRLPHLHPAQRPHRLCPF